jgi:hypothetical protein
MQILRGFRFYPLRYAKRRDSPRKTKPPFHNCLDTIFWGASPRRGGLGFPPQRFCPEMTPPLILFI